ncbi:pheromone A receptor-domain-containing protein [Amylostereum chailletii]|nr:pheromone A receptor-domain-containing protein [Amylostereum chailletii]
MAAPPNELFSVFAFAGFVLAAIPFYWHLQSWNVGTCLYMAWVSLGCLNAFINSIIWNNNVINWAPVWCDISSRFGIGLIAGIPSALLVIIIRLYKIAAMTDASVTRAEKRRAIIIDLSIGLGIPIVYMPLEYVVQGHRFDIIEDIGCSFTAWPTPVAWALYYPWPLVISLVSCVFACLAYWHLRQRTLQFQEFVSSNSSINQSRYLRLMGLAITVLGFTLVFNTLSVVLNAQTPIQPWISWEDTHFHFSDVGLLPRAQMTSIQEMTYEFQRWTTVVCAFVFFAFFGFADEAKKHYRMVYATVASRTGMSSLTASSATTSSFGTPYRSDGFAANKNTSSRFAASLPSASARAQARRASFDSFGDTISIGDLSGLDLEFKNDDPEKDGKRDGSTWFDDEKELPRPPLSLMLDNAPQHNADAPSSARPYSTWSEAV